MVFEISNNFWFKHAVLGTNLGCLASLSRKEGNVLFNDTLNTFYLRLYGVTHMVKDHSEDSERGNPLPPHGLLFLINSKGSFICPTDRITHTTDFVTPVVEHWLEREIWLLMVKHLVVL